jgi:hypothetical protein
MVIAPFSGRVGIGTTSPGYTLDVNGVGNFNGNQIHNVGTPSADSDVATKSYVDTVVSSGVGNYLPLSGGTLTGSIAMNRASVFFAGIGDCNAAVYSNVSASNCYVASHGNDTMAINGYNGIAFVTRASGDNVRMYIQNSNGNVGIGTTSPGYTLDVAGNARVQSGLTVSGNAGNLYGGSGEIWANGDNHAGGGLTVSDDGGFYDYNDAYITYNGSTGLRIAGNNGPGSSGYLLVQGNETVTGTLTAGAFSGPLSGTENASNISSGSFGSNTGGGTYTFPGTILAAGLRLNGTDGAVNQIWQSNSGYVMGITGNNAGLSLGGATSRQDLYINTNGSVGIGTTGPTAKLDVYYPALNNSSFQSLIRIGINNTVESPTGSFSEGAPSEGLEFTRDWSNGGQRTLEGGIYGYGASGWASGLAFRTAAYGGANYTRMVITDTGTVGIGTTNPQYTLDVNGTGNFSGKLTANTIDPLYTISGTNYATYVPGMTGEKEETAGTIDLQKNADGAYGYTMDFAGAAKGSDLWLFAQATNLANTMDQLIVSLTSSFDGNVWYTKNAAADTLTIHGTAAGEVSYTLTAPRFDAAQWPNLAPASESSAKGLIIN